jgi:hypothetical protein
MSRLVEVKIFFFRVPNNCHVVLLKLFEKVIIKVLKHGECEITPFYKPIASVTRSLEGEPASYWPQAL